MSGNIACGIDFGTSNSAIAIHHKNNIRLIEVENKEITIPSAMFFTRHDPNPLYGRKAIQSFLEGTEGRLMRSLKRVLGTSVMQQGTMINGKIMKFDKIIGNFINDMKQSAETVMQNPIEHVVLGRPVHFIDHDPEGDLKAQNELEQAALNIGFKHVEFQFEPIAAAYAHEVNLTSEKLALIVDIGGGTSDFTVIRLSNKSLDKPDRTDDILANDGVRMGGNDLDKKLSLECFMPEFGYRSTYGEKTLTAPLKPFQSLSEWSKVNFLYTNKLRMQIKQILGVSHDPERFSRLLNILENETGHTLLQEIEATKIKLTHADSAKAFLNFIEDSLTIDVPQSKFHTAIAEEIQLITATAVRCIQTANLKTEDINLVVLTGGSTEIPFLQNTIREIFQNAEFSAENKLSSVVTGLAYDSRKKFR